MDGKSNFFDSKTMIAILLVGLVFVGWQRYLQKKYPDHFKVKKENQVQGTQKLKAEKPLVQKDVVQKKKMTTLESPKAEETFVDDVEKFVVFEDKFWKIKLSSKGMAVRSIVLKKHTQRNGSNIVLSESLNSFSSKLLGFKKEIDFKIKQLSETEIVGVAELRGLKIVKKFIVNSESYTINAKIHVSGINAENYSGMTLSLSDKLEKQEKSNFLLPSFGGQQVYISEINDSERYMIQNDEALKFNHDSVNVVALGTQYFAMAILDASSVIPSVKGASNLDKEVVTSTLTYGYNNSGDTADYSMLLFAGPKSLELLKSVDPKLEDLIDYGTFSFIAKFMWQIMKVLFGFFGNWGVAIICLTLVVRLVLLPFNIKSYKSMKVMQEIQPELKELRERYKDDAQKMNQEVMRVMKENKANPLGGCLPMLMQFPIFIALYQVLGQSIELYQAPFIFWIQDLSLKDPYFVLPALMGASIFLQQKITPTTMDPAQAKAMMVIPFVMTFFMLSLPSGLTLYIFVSTLFGILQQFYFTKDRKKIEAKVKPQTA